VVIGRLFQCLLKALSTRATRHLHRAVPSFGASQQSRETT